MSHLNPDGTVNLDEPAERDELPAHLTAAAIAACTMCNDEGYRALVVCDHIDHTAETPGRAAFHAEMAKLRARRVEKAKGGNAHRTIRGSIIVGDVMSEMEHEGGGVAQIHFGAEIELHLDGSERWYDETERGRRGDKWTTHLISVCLWRWGFYVAIRGQEAR